ncbi:MAG TPA: hypothetical protein VFV02_00285 [Acidimicrobiales bacterium]|nr:hypothetical protein [Acidimicrobiales bacterium]
MRHPFRSAVAAAAVVTGAGVALAGGANAATSTTGLSDIKTKAAAAISARLDSLGTAQTAINNNRWLTSPDKAAALQIVSNDTSGLTALGQKIQNDTTVVQAAADYKTIFTGYRVYLLALPQIRLAAASDDLSTGVVPRLTDAQTRLETLLSGKYKDKNNSTIQAAMADLAKQIQAITQETNGLSATVLSYTPQQYDSNTSILLPARTAISTARSDAKAARQDVKTVRDELR